jgi:hypothetical protein
MREILCWLVFAYILAIVVRMVLSWFPSSGGLASDAERWLRTVRCSARCAGRSRPSARSTSHR